MGLVDYASDSESEPAPAIDHQHGKRPKPDGGGDPHREQEQVTTKRRRTLPSLPGAFTTGHQDDPTKHQGRTRSRPFVEGEYNAHLYITLVLPKALHEVLLELVESARSLVPNPNIHSFLLPLTSAAASNASAERSVTGRLPLHISLTHPLPLRRSQIRSFRDDLAHRLGELGAGASMKEGLGFRLSLAQRVSGYVNGRRYGGEGVGGRAFLALRVGAGSKEIENIIDKVVHPILAKLHLPLYHSQPEFHASFAWCLLNPHPPTAFVSAEEEDTRWTEIASVDPLEVEFESDQPDMPGDSPTPSTPPTPFTPAILSELSDAFQERILAAQPRGGWQIDSLDLKVAKDVFRLPLRAE